MENLHELFTSLSKSQEPCLACVSSFLTFVHSISQKGWGVAYVPSERSIFNGFIGFCLSSDLLALVGNQSVP